MILGIGIDSVDVIRFEKWPTYSQKKLGKIFHEQEVVYCLSNAAKSAERFAVRFALKEAFFKAYSSLPRSTRIPFLSICKKILVTHAQNNVPTLSVDWNSLAYKGQPPRIHVSLTHTKTLAVAVVVLSE